MLQSHGSTRRTGKRTVAVFVSATAVLASAIVGLVPGAANASSHREAPLTAGDPLNDNTDVYAFVSPDNSRFVTLIANWIPFEEPNGGPNFYPFRAGSNYNIHVDNNGDGLADITYEWVFTTQDLRGLDTFLYNNGPVTSFNDPNLLFKQTYDLTSIDGQGRRTLLVDNAPTAPSNTGPASFPNYQALRDEATVSFPNGKSFAGQADDPFFLDLRVFDLIYGGDLSEIGQDTLDGYNVNSVAIQVPRWMVALNRNSNGTDANGDGKADVGNPVIGVWSSTDASTIQAGTGTPLGAPVQVSRLGMPLVNELVIPAGLKDAFNTLEPAADTTIPQVVNRVLFPEVPELIEGIYGIPAPAGPRTDIAEIFLTGVTTQLDGRVFPMTGGRPYNAPIQLDLNSQAMNADVDAAAFVPSEMIRLNMSVAPSANPDRLGVLAGDLQGFPNGRRLTDDVVDIEIQALEGFFLTGLVEPLAAGDAVDTNDNEFGSTFPYLALPNAEAVNQGRTLAVAVGAGLAAMALFGVGAGTLIRRRRADGGEASTFDS